MANKYHAQRTMVDGITFASKSEAARYLELKLMQKSGQISDLKLQVPFVFEHNGVKIGKYIADFTYNERLAEFSNPIVEDRKGMRTSVYRLKAKMMKAFYGITIRET